ncbi:hypothetical protein KY495_09020 [Massilia sp. PAMC28688]|uniref:hypothetical protein n=1 Tax=Massilia sp. PAMC28688 TaxID=2861283 RepID=UPI001C637B1C|nr:hypothetical protein [Massilia sp. PAMC28688]QYF95273.1 hypothetical protein KY495_09020 [Massilia sp. PAMC28688]
MYPIARLLACSVLAWSTAAATAGNIVQDPGFEQGSKYWKSLHFALGPAPLWAHTDPGAARLTYCNYDACLNRLNEGAYVGQLLSTTAGELYDLTFWVRSFTGESRFSVFWDGALVTSRGTPNGPMQQYAFSGLAASANATLLQVHAFNSLHQHMSFDDFSVLKHTLPPALEPLEPQLPVSEPAMYGLILAALGGMMLAMRRPVA